LFGIKGKVKGFGKMGLKRDSFKGLSRIMSGDA
jgi:hypothetical protein